MTARQRWCAFAIILVAFLVRVWALDFKPAHFDEGVNGAFVDSMRRSGGYAYDPANYHGPLHFYVLFAGQQLFGRSLWVLRMPTVLIGTGVVVLMLMFRRFLPFRAVALAAGFIAVSPAMVFYSRYAIHEMWLPFFALLACYGGFGIASGERRKADVWCVGMGLTGMVLTKETYLLHWVATLLALIAVGMSSRFFPRQPAPANELRPADLFTGRPPTEDADDAESTPAAPPLSGGDVLKVWATSLGLLIAFYSAFGLHWPGVSGILDTFIHMQAKGTHAEAGHNKETLYWLKLLAYYEWPALAGFIVSLFIAMPRVRVLGALLLGIGTAMLGIGVVTVNTLPAELLQPDYLLPSLGANALASMGLLAMAAGFGCCFASPAGDFRMRWLALYGLASFCGYSLIPYKTAWCSINFLWPFAFALGFVLDRAWAKGRRTFIVLTILLLGYGSVRDTLHLNFVNPVNDALPPTDPKRMPDGERYAYVQTTFDIQKLLKPVRQLVAQDAHHQLTGHILGEAFPLIWELNDFPLVRFFEPHDQMDSYDADFLIVPDARKDEIEAELVGIYYRESYEPRGSGEPSWLYLQAERFAPVMPPDRTPEFKPRIPQTR